MVQNLVGEDILDGLSKRLRDFILSDVKAVLDAVQIDTETRRNAARYKELRNMWWFDGRVAVVLDPQRNIRLGAKTLVEGELDEYLDNIISMKEKHHENKRL